MITVFTPSYLTLIFSLKEYSINEIQVITYNNSIKKFCDRVGIKVVQRNLESDLSFNGLKNYRKMCNEMVAHMKKQDIIFCFYTFDVWSLYQLLLLRKSNRVYFYNTDYLSKPGYNEADSIKIKPVFNLFAHWKNPAFRKRLFRSVILFYLTRIWFDIYCFDGIYGHGLRLNFCKKKFLHYSKKSDSDIYLYKKTIIEKIELSKFDILFIDGGEIGFEFPDALLFFLKEFAANKKLSLAVKPHPTFPSSWNDPSIQKIEKNIPVELLYDLPKLIISVASSAILNIPKQTPVISVFRLMKFAKSDYSGGLENFLLENKVYTPQSVEELSKYLNSVFVE